MPRIAKATLQLPISLGSLALPCFVKYYWAAVLITVQWWLSEVPANPAATLEAALLDSYTEIKNLIHHGPRSNLCITASMGPRWRNWILGSHTPQCGVTLDCPILKPSLFEIKTFGDIVSDGGVFSFDDLKRRQALPNRMPFRYLQLRHPFQAQFP